MTLTLIACFIIGVAVGIIGHIAYQNYIHKKAIKPLNEVADPFDPKNISKELSSKLIELKDAKKVHDLHKDMDNNGELAHYGDMPFSLLKEYISCLSIIEEVKKISIANVRFHFAKYPDVGPLPSGKPIPIEGEGENGVSYKNRNTFFICPTGFKGLNEKPLMLDNLGNIHYLEQDLTGDVPGQSLMMNEVNLTPPPH